MSVNALLAKGITEICALTWLCVKYQKGHTRTWLQPQAKLLKNVSTIGPSAKKILILGQSAQIFFKILSYIL